MVKEKEKNIKGSSFLVKIKYQQNSSIQGTIHWLEENKIVNFRSMMEMMMLITENIDKKEIRTWGGSEGKLEVLEKIIKQRVNT
jgi:phosphotransferase system HPr-like phosphotransfer protein